MDSLHDARSLRTSNASTASLSTPGPRRIRNASLTPPSIPSERLPLLGPFCPAARRDFLVDPRAPRPDLPRVSRRLEPSRRAGTPVGRPTRDRGLPLRVVKAPPGCPRPQRRLWGAPKFRHLARTTFRCSTRDPYRARSVSTRPLKNTYVEPMCQTNRRRRRTLGERDLDRSAAALIRRQGPRSPPFVGDPCGPARAESRHTY